MTRRTRAALAVQTALVDHMAGQLDAARAVIAARDAELACTQAVAQALLERNAVLASREPVVVLPALAQRAPGRALRALASGGQTA